jgi:hypothetical protein
MPSGRSMLLRTYRHMTFAAGTFVILLAFLTCLWFKVNTAYRRDAEGLQKRNALVQCVHLAAPVLATAGRNIAFESGNAVSNAPASYLTMLDCCESDEAIADRIAVAKTTSRLVKRSRGN